MNTSYFSRTLACGSYKRPQRHAHSLHSLRFNETPSIVMDAAYHKVSHVVLSS